MKKDSVRKPATKKQDHTGCQLKALTRKEILTRVSKRDKQLQDNSSHITLLSGESVTRTFYDILQQYGKPRSIPMLSLEKPTYEDNNT